jgi:hypothetical protein
MCVAFYTLFRLSTQSGKNRRWKTMANLTQNGWKTTVEVEQTEVEWAKAVAQARNYLNKVV